MNISKLSFTALVVLLLVSCKDMTKLQNDPNRTTQATPDLLLTGIEETAFNQVSRSAALASRYLVYTNGNSDEQYYSWQRAGFGGYANLRQVLKMKQAAKRTDEQQYNALAKFFNSFFIVHLTKTFGDIPYSEALKGEGAQFKPPYDQQKDIYIQVLNDLQSANQMLAENPGPINGDIIYDGDITKWRKLINSYSLRILISLSHKTGNNELNVEQRFQDIISNPQQYPIMTSNADNGELHFYDKESNRYPYYNDNDFHTAYFMEKTFVDRLKNLKDPRLFAFAAPKPNASNQPKSFAAYDGALGSAPLNDIVQKEINGEGSGAAERYYNNPTNEPSIALGYAETEFNVAEAIQRGWVSGDMRMYYQNGIGASMQFYGIADTTVNNYLQHDGVELEDGQQLQQILTQKYISFYMNSGYMPFYNQRRTGIPEFDVSGGGLSKERVPNRWMYPESELQNNTENVQAAIKHQYPDGDDIYAKMWLLKDE